MDVFIAWLVSSSLRTERSLDLARLARALDDAWCGIVFVVLKQISLGILNREKLKRTFFFKSNKIILIPEFFYLD
jgi:hypothetical protein